MFENKFHWKYFHMLDDVQRVSVCRIGKTLSLSLPLSDASARASQIAFIFMCLY